MFGRLMPTEGKFFELFSQHADLCVKGAKEMVSLMTNFDDLENRVNAIEGIEKEADKVTHATIEMLHKTFITPIDRDEVKNRSHRDCRMRLEYAGRYYRCDRVGSIVKTVHEVKYQGQCDQGDQDIDTDLESMHFFLFYQFGIVQTREADPAAMDPGSGP